MEIDYLGQNGSVPHSDGTRMEEIPAEAADAKCKGGIRRRLGRLQAMLYFVGFEFSYEGNPSFFVCHNSTLNIW